MRIRSYRVLLIALAMSAGLGVPSGALWAAGPVSIMGKIAAKEGPLEGAYVGAHREGTNTTTFVMSNEKGEFAFRGLAPGSYAVYTRIPGFHKVVKDKVVVQAGRQARADFQVVPETDFMTLVSQASNAELLESLPLTKDEKLAFDSRCSTRCHGISYIVGSRFSAKDWKLILNKMGSGVITATADIDMGRPPRAPGSGPADVTNRGTDDYLSVGQKGTLNDDDHLIEYLTKIAGPDTKNFPIKFQPRATGKFTRAVVTEFQIPRPGAFIHDLLLDPRGGYAWYNDWRFNAVGRVDIKTGEIKEFLLPGRDDRPPGAQHIRWDQSGNLWVSLLFAGQVVRFDTKALTTTGIWSVPQEWPHTTAVVVCPTSTHPNGPVWAQDSFSGAQWTLNPETGKFTEVKNAGWSICDRKGNLWGMRAGVMRKTEPGLEKFTEYKAPTPKSAANENNLNEDSAGNIWYGDWNGGLMAYLNTETGKITEFRLPGAWSLAYNAIGDGKNQVGWTVPHMSDRMVKADAKTGEVTEFTLPSNGYQIRNLDIDLTTKPPTVWFMNQQDGTVVRFQENTE